MSEERTKKESFEIQRIYIKDVSFEAPNTPRIFHKAWDPNTQFKLNATSKKIEKNIFEVVLKVKIIVKIQGDLVFLCDVHQAGIFFICNLNEIKLEHCLYSYCPNILFPYARACISSLVSSASFPSLNITPIDFDNVYYNDMKFKKN